MNTKIKTKVVLLFTFLVLMIGGGIAGYVGSKDTLFKGALPLGTTGGDATQTVTSSTTCQSATTQQTCRNRGCLWILPRIVGISTIPGHCEAHQTVQEIPGAHIESQDIPRQNNLGIQAPTSGTTPVSPSGSTPQNSPATQTISTNTQTTAGSGSTLTNGSTILAIQNKLIISADPNFTNQTMHPGETGTIASFRFQNLSANPIAIKSIKFHKTVTGGQMAVNKNDISILSLYINNVRKGLDKQFDSTNVVSWTAPSLFTINRGATVTVTVNATFIPAARAGGHVLLEIRSGDIGISTTSITIEPQPNWNIRSAITTIIATASSTGEFADTMTGIFNNPDTSSGSGTPDSGGSTPPPAAASTYLNVALSPSSTASNTAIATNQLVAIGDYIFTSSRALSISNITIKSKPAYGAVNILPFDKIEKIQLCTMRDNTTENFCTEETAFNASGTTSIRLSTLWEIGSTIPLRTQTLRIKAKIKSDAVPGNKFSLGIYSSSSITATAAGEIRMMPSDFPVWSNEMVIAAAPAITPIAPISCTNGRVNNDGANGGACVCPSGLNEYPGGQTETYYSPSVCIPCTVSQLVSSGEYYCPQHLPANTVVPPQVSCTELQVSPATFVPNIARQTFQSSINPTNFSGVIIWRHYKNGQVVESTNGRTATFTLIGATSRITADALPASNQTACTKTINAGQAVTTNQRRTANPPANQWPSLEAVPSAPSLDEPTAQPTNTGLREAAQTPSANLGLDGSQRLRRAPDKSETGPEVLVYFGILAVIQGGIILRKKLRK